MRITTMQEQLNFARKTLKEMQDLRRAQGDIHLQECIITTLEHRVERGGK